jgi:hypothetical protein
MTESRRLAAIQRRPVEIESIKGPPRFEGSAALAIPPTPASYFACYMATSTGGKTPPREAIRCAGLGVQDLVQDLVRDLVEDLELKTWS